MSYTITQEQADEYQQEAELEVLGALAADEYLSNCCGAYPIGETDENVGRCSDCFEMAHFSEEEV